MIFLISWVNLIPFLKKLTTKKGEKRKKSGTKRTLSPRRNVIYSHHDIDENLLTLHKPTINLSHCCYFIFHSILHLSKFEFRFLLIGKINQSFRNIFSLS